MHIVAFGLKLQLWKKNKHIWAHLCSLISNFTATHTQTLVRPAAETVCARCHGRSLTRGFLIKLPFPCYFWGKSFHTRMQNISLLALQNNCLVTSQIRLSWKIKLLLLISHRPHAHMQHSCKYWKSAALQAWGDLWAQLSCLTALHRGVQSQPDHPTVSQLLQQSIARATAPWDEYPGALCGLSTTWPGALPVIRGPVGLRAELQPLPPSWEAPRRVPCSSSYASDHALSKLLGVGFVLFCFHQTGECATEYFFFFFYISEAIILLLPRLPNKITYLESILLHAQNLQGTA